MRMSKANTIEDYRLLSNFESVRKQLMQPQYNDRLEKPLAYWALPNDRRLPLAFLGRTLSDLLETPFEELTATPGVGQKKICSLVKLLHRATEDTPPSKPFGLDDSSQEKRSNGHSTEEAAAKPQAFDPSMVSEVLWDQWRETVRRHDLGREELGRLAPSLASLPTVIWKTPLSAYLNHGVAEIRHMKTHGEKRVRVVLEIFYEIHQLLDHVDNQSRLAFRLAPRFVPELEAWMSQVMQSDTAPTLAEVKESFVAPLIEQTLIDAGETVHQLACGRLGFEGDEVSVRQQAQEMGVTRARIYQLLDECGRIMEVRWPHGRCQFNAFIDRSEEMNASAEVLNCLKSTRELYFPNKFDRTEDER